MRMDCVTLCGYIYGYLQLCCRGSINIVKIIILNEFDKQEVANAEVQNLINKGFSCDVFYLPGVSNSNKKVYQTYIGPFNKKNEAYHYLNALISPKGLLEDETEKSSVGTVVELQ